ncbi:MAG: hypothetical protein KF720_16095 [Rubrivivax sp.]|nr:hypothetical protein [Rubrivivax sp.]
MHARFQRMGLSSMLARVSCAAAVLVLAGCGGGEVGGTVSGLGSGLSVTLLNNGADALSVPRNGSFTFAQRLDPDSAYAVTVGTQPVGQTCSVANGSGTLDAQGSSVDNVSVSCAFIASLRGTVNGLASGLSLVLSNGSERLAVTADGAFAFATVLADGTRYDVQVVTQPAIGGCSVSNGSGLFYADRFSDIVVSCN